MTYKGELVGIGSRNPVQLSNTQLTIFGPIRAKRGRHFEYTKVRLALTSECDDGVDTWRAVDGAVYYNLKWKPQCAVAEIDAELDASSRAGSLFPSG